MLTVYNLTLINSKRIYLVNETLKSFQVRIIFKNYTIGSIDMVP